MLAALDRLDIFLIIISTLIATAAGVHGLILRRALSQRTIETTAQSVAEHEQQLENIQVCLATLTKEAKSLHDVVQRLSELPLVIERDYLKKEDAPCGGDIQETAKRLAVLETESKKQGDLRKEINEIHSRLNDVAHLASQQAGELKQINNTLHLIQQHLLNT